MITLIGEAPGRVSIADRPALALTGSSGKNLCAIAGWDWLDYLRHTRRLNLFLDPQPKWDREAARRVAREEGPNIVELYDSVILLGAKVADAFRATELPDYEWRPVLFSGTRVARIPHPSGRNRVWNDPAERERARAFLHGLVP